MSTPLQIADTRQQTDGDAAGSAQQGSDPTILAALEDAGINGRSRLDLAALPGMSAELIRRERDNAPADLANPAGWLVKRLPDAAAAEAKRQQNQQAAERRRVDQQAEREADRAAIEQSRQQAATQAR